MVGASPAEAAANMERGSVPSSMELRGSAGADEEEEEDEEVLPLRAPRRVFVSVTWVERQVWDKGCCGRFEALYRRRNRTNIVTDVQFLYACEQRMVGCVGLPWWAWGDGTLQTRPQQPRDDISAARRHSCGHGNALLREQISSAASTSLKSPCVVFYIWLLLFTLISICLRLFLRHICHDDHKGHAVSPHDREMCYYRSKN